MTKKIGAAVIGLGVGMAHCKGYQTNPDADLVAICDIDPIRLKERGDFLGVADENRYLYYQDMLKRDDIDVVSVALPNYLHMPVTLDAFKAGKNVLCEKPISTTVENALKMVAESQATGLQLMVCFNYRFREDVVWLKQMRDAGKFGDIYYARAGWQRNTGIPGFGGWFTTKSMSGGGPMIDLSVHVMDMTLSMMGYPNPISVSGATFAKFGPRGQKASGGSFGVKEADSKDSKPASTTFDVEDLATGFVRFDNGAVLSVETSWATHSKPGKDDYFITWYGTEGGADLYVGNYTDRDTVMFYNEEAGQPVAIKPNIVNRAAPHTLATAHMVESLKNNTPVTATGQQGTTLVKIIQGLYESAQTGREVRLD